MEPKIIFVSQEALKDFETCIVKAQVKPAYIVVFGDSKGKYISFDDFLKPQVNGKQFKVYETNNPKKTAAIMFSSGTTGLPKGICLNHYTLLSQSGSFGKDAFDGDNLASFDRVVLLYPTLYWVSRVCVLIGSILRGEANVICRSFDPKSFLRVIEKYKVTSTFVPLYYLPPLIKEPSKNKFDLSSLKVLLTGSCPVTAQLMKETIDAFPETIVKLGYGQTEVAGAVARFTLPKDQKTQKKRLTSCGRIYCYFQWKIVDLETEQPVTGPNKKGELRLKTDLHMNGYYKMDSSDVFDSEGYLKTGDIAYYDEDNYLFIVDRIKEMFKYRGWHILRAIVEEVIMGHPAVKEAAVVGIPHPEDGDHAMALVTLKKGYETVTSEEIRKFADGRLSDAQKLRAGVKILDELARTATGKLKRRAMREMILSHKKNGSP
nr:unnamed protein product [Callosobruchus analis]